MDEINWFFLTFKILVFFAMMWSLSLIVPGMAKSIKDNKETFFVAAKEQKFKFLLFFILLMSVFILSFY
jgi:hypothetical protein